MDRTASYYSQPSYIGAGLPVFSGSRRQRGGGILGSIQQMVSPVLSTIGGRVKNAALHEAIGLAKDVAGDVLSGNNIGQSLKRRGLTRLKNVGLQALGVAPSRKRSHPIRRSKRTRPKKKQRRRLKIF